MELVLDFHLHSRFSRAVSQKMNLTNMYLWGKKKGINVLSISDFTHPIWFREAKGLLDEVSDGIYTLKDRKEIDQGPYFILSTEVSSIYSEKGEVHRIHNLIFAPNFDVALKINQEFNRRSFNLLSDGRPTFGLSAKNLSELLFSIDPTIAIIPCHVWTPWFSLYGSRSGYDSIADCFGEFSKYIFAVESGLSSDPSMNWRIKELETRSIVSFSDAHSLEKMGREATVLKLKDGISNDKFLISNITYKNILNAFVRGKERIFEIGYTIEFYPEEGKYHYTGHRNCGVSYSPSNTPKDALCPVCKKPLTVGVMHRVDELATEEEKNYVIQEDKNGVFWVNHKENKRPPYVSLVPLLEVLAEVLESGVGTLAVTSAFDKLTSEFGSEHEVLLRSSIDKIRTVSGDKVAEGIQKVRNRNIEIEPGFDGEYGKVKIGFDGEKVEKKEEGKQLGLF